MTPLQFVDMVNYVDFLMFLLIEPFLYSQNALRLVRARYPLDKLLRSIF